MVWTMQTIYFLKAYEPHYPMHCNDPLITSLTKPTKPDQYITTNLQKCIYGLKRSSVKSGRSVTEIRFQIRGPIRDPTNPMTK